MDMHTRSRSAAVALIPMFLVLGACGSAVTGGGPQSDDRLIAPPSEAMFSYGKAYGEAHEMLGDEVDLAFDARGQVYILDPANYRVLVLNSDGEFLRSLGREGDGPGEFQSPLHMLVDPDGTVSVLDGGARAFIRFDSEGEYIGNTRTSIGFAPAERVAYLGAPGEAVLLGVGIGRPPSTGGARGTGAPRPSAIETPDGSSTPTGQPSPPRGGAGQGGWGSADEFPETTPIRRVSLIDGTTELAHQAWKPVVDVDLPEVRDPRGWSRGPRADRAALLPQVQLGAFSDGRIAVLDSTTYEIDIIQPGGSIQRTLSRAIPPRPVTDKLMALERDRRIAEIEAGESELLESIAIFSGRGMDNAARQRILRAELEQMEEMLWAPEVPVVSRMVADRAGYIWVERTPESLQGPGWIDVLSVDRGYLGSFAPGTTEIPDAFGPRGLAAFVERDEYDVPIVVVRRLPDPIR